MTALGNRPSSASGDRDKEAARRERFRQARLLTRLNADLFGGTWQGGEIIDERRVGGKRTGAERIGTCGERRGETAGLRVVANGDGRVSWTGIETCGSVWSCLACAAKIRAARAEEIDFLAKAHLAAGGYCTFLTFTIRHVATDNLKDLLEAKNSPGRPPGAASSAAGSRPLNPSRPSSSENSNTGPATATTTPAGNTATAGSSPATGAPSAADPTGPEPNPPTSPPT